MRKNHTNDSTLFHQMKEAQKWLIIAQAVLVNPSASQKRKEWARKSIKELETIVVKSEQYINNFEDNKDAI